MSARKAKRYEPDDLAGKLTVKIIDEESGLRVIENVRSVRIRDKEYVLLIMDEYSATIGEINGEVAILTRNDEIKLEDVKGFYRLRNNELTLILHD